MPSPNPSSSLGRLNALAQVIETVHRLRAPDGCPWDRAQTHQTLRPFLIEEAYEALEIMDRIDSARDLERDEIRLPFKEELGDVLMQVLLHAEMASETQAFDFIDVAAALNEKLVRRHPHVFMRPEGSSGNESVDSVLQKWELQKQTEKAHNPDASVLDGVPKGLPALQRAGRVIEKVTKVGFQWEDMQGPLAKVEEELQELKTEVLSLEKLAKRPENAVEADRLRSRVADELGDLFFTLANVAHLMKISPEDTLRAQLSRFEKRFRHVEKRIKETGKRLDESTLAEMDVFWEEAKKLEKGTE